jgi:hypothetical protein
MRKSFVMLATIALLLGALAPASASRGTQTDTADVFDQGEAPDGDVYAEDGATLRRTNNGIQFQLRMPTPEPGSYAYPGPNPFQPEGAKFVEGTPEAYSLWVFLFNYPDKCNGPCDGDDIGDTPAMGGVFAAAGHLVGGSTLTLAGHVSTSHEPFDGSPLVAPRTAQVHLAVAPHGALQPEILPEQITRPLGDPSFWWTAIFD